MSMLDKVRLHIYHGSADEWDARQIADAEETIKKLNKIADDLLAAIDHGMDIYPHCTENSVTDPSGTIDEGAIRFNEWIEKCRKDLEEIRK